MELITVSQKDFNNEYKNAITEELDQYVIRNHKPSIDYGGGSYLYGYICNGHMGIRFPGATRGTVRFNEDGVISDIWLYDDEMARSVQCYKQEAYDAVKKYIGAKLIFV